MHRLLALLTVAALLAGCSTRERANPFDPSNPSTNGRPEGFVALAGNGRVTMRWQNIAAPDLIGYQLFRRGPYQAGYTDISGVMQPDATQFYDLAVGNGYDYAYRLYFVFKSGLGTRPAEDIATPGPAEPWLVENGGTDLIGVTPDDRHVAIRPTGFGGTNDVAVNPADGTVWISEIGSGQVTVLNPATGVRTTIPGVQQPAAIAVDPFDGTAWVCDFSSPINTVHHFRRLGDPASFDISGVLQPVDAAVDVEDGSVWVCERGGNRVSRFDSGASAIWACPCSAPTRVAVDSTTREGWVTSSSRGTVTRIDLSGQPLDTLGGFTSPVGIGVDARRNRIWVADPRAGQLVALRRDGSVEFRVGGLADAGELAVDVRTGDVWAVLGNPGELVQVSAVGVVMRRLGGFRIPISVAVAPNGH